MSGIKQRFDVVAARKYQARDGQEKTQWINVGRAVEWDDGGMEVELNAMPCFPDWNGKLKLFVQKPRDLVHQKPEPRRVASNDVDGDSVPF